MTPITVFGAGSWGTALALVLARNGHDVMLWGHQKDHIAALLRSRANERYLPGIVFPDNLRVSHDLGHAATHARLWLIVSKH